MGGGKNVCMKERMQLVVKLNVRNDACDALRQQRFEFAARLLRKRR